MPLLALNRVVPLSRIRPVSYSSAGGAPVCYRKSVISGSDIIEKVTFLA